MGVVVGVAVVGVAAVVVVVGVVVVVVVWASSRHEMRHSAPLAAPFLSEMNLHCQIKWNENDNQK